MGIDHVDPVNPVDIFRAGLFTKQDNLLAGWLVVERSEPPDSIPRSTTTGGMEGLSSSASDPRHRTLSAPFQVQHEWPRTSTDGGKRSGTRSKYGTRVQLLRLDLFLDLLNEVG